MDNPATSSLGPEATRFLASMTITFDMWHDGLGYDLNALAKASSAERDVIEKILIDHRPRDWRDVEALAQIPSPAAQRAVEECLNSPDANIRRTARTYAGAKADPTQREQLLVQSLLNGSLLTGDLSAAIDEAATFHPPGVIDALLRGTLHQSPVAAVNFAALLMYLHGKAAEPFDWAQRPFFLRFSTDDCDERRNAFVELCEKIGVDAAPYLR
jgi:hypothetical protein